MINHFFADVIKYIHIILFCYILVGHQITPIVYLKYYLYLIIFIFLDWNDFDGQCILTRLEHGLRTGNWNQKPAIEPDSPQFFRPLVNNLFNLKLSSAEADRLNNFIFMMCLLFGLVRLIEN